MKTEELLRKIHYEPITTKDIDEYEPLSDARYRHPIFHEVIGQSGSNSKDKNLLNNNLKTLCNSDKFMKLFHNDNYRDTYGNTALERLCCMMHFQQYDDNIKNWIKENLKKGELIVDPSKSSFDYDFHKCEILFDYLLIL